ncbi:MAG TPA: peroxiredoxin [Acidimicrobiales bacterium]|nr:peroxiredoxin [Acidimicrobiales bacterium]
MQVGEIAPDVALEDQSGTVRRLSELADGKRVVLFFYPAAMTSGCTKETCHFRDLAAEFAAADAVRVGISMDRVDKQAKFADAHGVDFPLLSDPDGAVAKAFGVKRALAVLKVRRTTFVLDEHRRVLDVIHAELNTDAHADRALRVLADTPAASGPTATEAPS